MMKDNCLSTPKEMYRILVLITIAAFLGAYHVRDDVTSGDHSSYPDKENFNLVLDSEAKDLLPRKSRVRFVPRSTSGYGIRIGVTPSQFGNPDNSSNVTSGLDDAKLNRSGWFAGNSTNSSLNNEIEHERKRNGNALILR